MIPKKFNIKIPLLNEESTILKRCVTKSRLPSFRGGPKHYILDEIYDDPVIMEIKSHPTPRGIMQGTPIVVIDIDGTITDASARAEKYLSKETKDWDGFYEACGEDKPIEPIIELVQVLSVHYDIVFCSGRRQSVEQNTKDWFNKHHIFLQDDPEWLFRKNGDKRHDTLVKPELLNEYLAQHPDKKVAYILDDRNSMVAKWRELGYTCLQVADGDF